MSDPRSEMRKWIADVRKRHGGLGSITFRLRHCRGEESSSAVDQLTVDPKEETSDEDIERWAGEKSAQDATVLRGTQRYGLFLYIGEQFSDPRVSGPSVGRFTWLVQSGDVDVGDHVDLGSTEKADAKGQLAQQMRLTETFARLLVQSTTSTNVSQEKELRRLTEQVRWYAERDAKRQIEHEEVLNHQQARQLALEKHRTNQQHLQDLMFTVRGLLPICVNFMAGRSMIPVGTTPERETLRVFMESLTMEQFMGLQAILNPNQMMAVGQVWQHFAEEEKRRKAVQPPAPPPDPSGSNPTPTNGAN
jgi:hypothetical protein